MHRQLLLIAVLAVISTSHHAQIIADHTVVDQYDDIPQQYIDSVKAMLVCMAGQSHAEAYQHGQELLELYDEKYQVLTYESDPPPVYSDQYLRIGSTWRIGENYFFHQSKVDEMKSMITTQHESGNPYDVMGFGWCWDMTWQNPPGGTEDPVYKVHWAGASSGGPDGNQRWGLDSGDSVLTGNRVCMDTYLDAVEQYNEYCSGNGYPTKWVFTTGPVDGNSGTENGFQREIKHDYIRDFVNEDESRILFDYADILCWNSEGEKHMADWNDEGEIRSHAQIHPENMMNYDESFNMVSGSDSDQDHIGEVGAMRLAKAMWWMLARMAGWDGNTEASVEDEEASQPNNDVSVTIDKSIIKISTSKRFSRGLFRLYDFNGKLVRSSRINDNITYIHASSLSAGPYIISITKDELKEVRKIILTKKY